MKNKFFVYTIIFGTMLFLTSTCKKDEPPPETVSDIQGNIYKTVKIGNQIWMTENLKTTMYNDGTEIPKITDAISWSNLTSGGYCWYNNDELTYQYSYGALYNGYSVNSGRLCPSGWHVPQIEEWERLREFIGDSTKGGGKLKEAGTDHWLTPNKGADNISGFTALPAGIRYFEGTYASLSYFTGIWSSTETGPTNQWYMSLYFGDATFSINHINKKYGFSVRCIKDE
jgi:uncharacterized protein (TIGR02145 family)